MNIDLKPRVPALRKRYQSKKTTQITDRAFWTEHFFEVGGLNCIGTRRLRSHTNGNSDRGSVLRICVGDEATDLQPT